MRGETRSIAAAGLTAWLIALQGCAEVGLQSSESTAGLLLPHGFSATVFADGIGRARHIVVNANGDVYVALRADDTVPGAKRPARTSTVAGTASGHQDMSPPMTSSAPPSQRKATSGFTKM